MDTVFTSIQNALVGSKVYYHPVTESTNSLASIALKESKPEGAVFIADFQERGRGQRGNFWESEAGANATFSILVYPSFLPIFDHFYLSKVVANGMIMALERLGVKATIKWPNDIYVGDKKIAGILIENGIMGTNLSHSIWGIGLNINQTIFKGNAPNPTSLLLERGSAFDRNQVLHEVLKCLDHWYLLLRNQDLEAIDQYYFGSLYRSSGLFPFMADGELFMAAIDSIEHTGELVLKTEKGERRTFAFKEVSFVI